MINITLPIPEKISTNEAIRQSWHKRKAQVDLYYESLIEFRNEKIKEYPVEITYIFTFKSKPLDSTNCSFMGKLLEDAMIHWGILEDDDLRYVGASTFIPRKGDEDSVEIIIT